LWIHYFQIEVRCFLSDSYSSVIGNLSLGSILFFNPVAVSTGDNAKLKVFEEALAQQQFSATVEMLKDAIPAKLLILDGRNPLTLLYGPLNVQIHELNHAQCLQQAADIRAVLNETSTTSVEC
jgi:hypothetical protein